MTVEALSYAIDQHHLVRVDEGYYGFAGENGWGGADASLGRSLWDYVAGEEMRKVQWMLLRTRVPYPSPPRTASTSRPERPRS